MENSSSLKSTQVRYFNQYTEIGNFMFNENGVSCTSILKNILSEEGGEDFYEYLSWIRLSTEPSLMVLSSKGHYYYDHNDLIGIKVLVNQKCLNQVRHLESFLSILFRMLPPKANFIGTFKNSNHITDAGYFQNQSWRLNEVLNVLSTNTKKTLTKRSVTRILENYRFEVIDMTEIKGLTYFWAQSSKGEEE